MNYKIITLTILLCFIILYLISDNKNKQIERFINAADVSDVHYVFWTGGYDSTFRLCEMLVNEQKVVQPIYINFNLD